MMHAPRPPLPIHARMTCFGARSNWDAAIIIPAKDEARRIQSCLTAAGQAAALVKPDRVGLIVVVNNTTDATANHVSSWAAGQDVPVILIVCHFDPADAGVGSARRLGFDLGYRTVQSNGALLTTDADTLVASDWVRRNLAELRSADLICGKVNAIASEAAALPPEIAGHGSAEGDYVAAAVELAALLDPRPHDPAPTHHNAPGASLAIRRKVYAAVGGLPIIQIGEDRALAALVEDHDFRVRYADTVVVETSCRMTGRTEGGMAGALRARAFEANPFADEWLEPAATFYRRHRLRAALRAVWPNETRLRQILGAHLGPGIARTIMAADRPGHFGQFFYSVEQTAPALARRRMRLGDCRAQLSALQAMLTRMRMAADKADDVQPDRRIHAMGE